jgi:hypothetical protein
MTTFCIAFYESYLSTRFSPSLKDLHLKKTGFSDPHTIEYKYTPEQAGKHVVMITWAGKEIPR